MGGLDATDATMVRRLLREGRITEAAKLEDHKALRRIARHLIRLDVPILPGVKSEYQEDYSDQRLSVVVRGDEQGRIWWPDWKRSPGYKGGRMGRLAPPRDEEELAEMLQHPNPRVRELVISLVRRCQKTALRDKKVRHANRVRVHSGATIPQVGEPLISVGDT